MKRIQVLAKRTAFDPARRLSLVVSTIPVNGTVWADSVALGVGGQGKDERDAVVNLLRSVGYQLWQVAA